MDISNLFQKQPREYPRSPHRLLLGFCSQFQQGEIDGRALLDVLNQMERHLLHQRQQLEAIVVTPGYSDGQELVEDSAEALSVIIEAVQILKEYALSPQPEVYEEAMEMAEEASDFMAELIQVTEENMDELEDDHSARGMVLA